MEHITVNTLKLLCDEMVEKGNGNKKIVISNDEEGNDFHPLYYGFTSAEKMRSSNKTIIFLG